MVFPPAAAIPAGRVVAGAAGGVGGAVPRTGRRRTLPAGGARLLLKCKTQRFNINENV